MSCCQPAASQSEQVLAALQLLVLHMQQMNLLVMTSAPLYSHDSPRGDMGMLFPVSLVLPGSHTRAIKASHIAGTTTA